MTNLSLAHTELGEYLRDIRPCPFNDPVRYSNWYRIVETLVSELVKTGDVRFSPRQFIELCDGND